VLAHQVHRLDRRAGPQQGGTDGLLVGQGNPWCRQRQQGGTAAGDQRQHEVVRTEPGHQIQDPAGGPLTRGVGHRVRRLHDLNVRARNRVPVAGHHQPTQRAVPGLLHCLRHPC
jgi:hypothetical protein